MYPCGSRPFTRRQAADAQRQDENAKRIKMISNLAATCSPNDIIVEGLQAHIKTEPVQIKTEPVEEETYGEIDVDVPIVSVKDEVEVHIEEEEIIISDTDQEPDISHGDSSASDEEEVEESHTKLEAKANVVLELNQRLATREIINEGDPASAEATHRVKDDPVDDRVTKLFPQVLEVMRCKFFKSRKDAMDYINLNCRLVCKDWCNGMINLMRRVDRPLQTEFRTVATFSPKETNTIRQWLNMDKPCPFPPTTLLVRDNSSYIKSPFELEVFRLTLRPFLERFGGGIKSFDYTIDYINIGCSLQDWYFTFQSWLELMPNIQVLTLREHNEANISTDMVSRIILTELVDLNPIGQLHHLKKFSVFGHGYSDPLIRSIFSTQRSLETGQWRYHPTGHSDQFKFIYSSSSIQPQFSASIATFQIVVTNYANLMTLASLRALGLKTLQIAVPANLPSWVPRIVKTVEKFQNLDSLLLSIPVSSWPPPLMIKKLEKLHIIFTGAREESILMEHKVGQLVSLMTSLRQLRIDNVYVDLGLLNHSSGVVDISRHALRQCVKSEFIAKLWRQLPKLNLKKIRVTARF